MRLSVRARIPKPQILLSHLDTTNFLCILLVGCGNDSVFLWGRFDTLCTSGFLDDVMLADNWPDAGNTSRAFT